MSTSLNNYFPSSKPSLIVFESPILAKYVEIVSLLLLSHNSALINVTVQYRLYTFAGTKLIRTTATLQLDKSPKRRIPKREVIYNKF